MINVDLITGDKMAVEGARIHIEDYEQFSFYAIPRVLADFTITDDRWDVVEESSGLAISRELDICKTIDDAVYSATANLRQNAPPERLALVIQSRLKALGRLK